MPTPDADIVRYAIYPPIGIARVGNSTEIDGYFLAPQVPSEVPPLPYKDENGAVKRQAALFRVYGLNSQGQALKEITAADAQIEWRVHLANRKAAWYQFNNAMDLRSNDQGYGMEAGLRNNSITGEDRQQLVIDPRVRTIKDRNQSGVYFSTGEFMGVPIYLGELRTDEKGHLLVLGGHGQTRYKQGTCGTATTFANNDGWCDDTSDGPVYATVRVDGKQHEAEPAMVVVAPPNYGQGLYSVVTMYDLLVDLFHREMSQDLPQTRRVSFWQEIYPIFERLVQFQWVNQGTFILFGKGSPCDLTEPNLLARLSDPSPSERNKALRKRILNWFRNPEANKEEPVNLPPLYGDASFDFGGLAQNGLALTVTQYERLRVWADGEFDSDQSKHIPSPHSLDALPVAEHPYALTRAALEECLGGPFHPGIELTWIMRVPSMWKEPFRLKILCEGEQVKDDYGPILRPAICLGENGPLQSSGPGTLTRWMGVPWQTDGASCGTGYDPSTYLPLPSFWATRVPNEVLSEEAYQRMIDLKVPLEQRLKHFSYRQYWLRDLGVTYQERINKMITSWHQIGIIAPRPGIAPTEGPQIDLPESVWVETQRDERFKKADPTWLQVQIAEAMQQEGGEREPVRLYATKDAPTLPQVPTEDMPDKLPDLGRQLSVPERRRFYRRDER